MKANDWVANVGLYTIAGVIGIALGCIIQAKTPIEIDHKIRYSELINWLITIFIGFWVGYRLKNDFENNKTIKSMLIDDVKFIISELHKSNSLFSKLRSEVKENEFDNSQQQSINFQLNYVDQRIYIFCEALKENYNSHYREIQQKLVDKFLELNKIATDPDDVNQSYFDNVTRKATALESELKSIVQKIVSKM
ncbi:hypothetical protein GCM10028824_17740 [Hymenobacter segetis]|uniref:Uncharacterized protein n=1 Tax=Hymenobacter segetis TaxID=2025509 RepID=A0ABU9LWL1_9BACT